MGMKMDCDCGFTASGTETSVEELQEIAMVHVKHVHPEMLAEAGEEGIRAKAAELITEY